MIIGNENGGRAMLRDLQDTDAEDEIERLRAGFYRPQPQGQVGQKLQGMASACIDISDGLIADLGHICQASGVTANLDSKLLPIPPDVTRQFPQQALDWALSGGDDYQLCFTVAESSRDRIERLILSGELDATMIGEILPSAETGSLVMVDKIGAQLNKGFDHFGH